MPAPALTSILEWPRLKISRNSSKCVPIVIRLYIESETGVAIVTNMCIYYCCTATPHTDSHVLPSLTHSTRSVS